LQIALLATSDEETGSSASKALIKELASSAPYVLVFESALDGQVKIGRKGTAMYHITVHGKAAHAGLEPEKGINASIEMAALILQVAKLGDPINGTTVVPTTAKSGTTTNTVPAMASFDVDIRSFSAAELIRVDGAIHALRAQDGASRVEITGGINRPPLEESSTRELFHLLQECGRELGMPEIGGVSVGGASDGNFAAAAGAKVLDGIGAVGAGAHADHEHLLVDSIEPRIALTTALLRKLVS
jgi:glutamate carboxypeptidase